MRIICVSTDSGATIIKPFWVNFMKEFNLRNMDNSREIITLEKALNDHHATDVPESVYINFKSEEDALAFILKYS